jgi:hypothetical protein
MSTNEAWKEGSIDFLARNAFFRLMRFETEVCSTDDSSRAVLARKGEVFV